MPPIAREKEQPGPKPLPRALVRSALVAVPLTPVEFERLRGHATRLRIPMARLVRKHIRQFLE